MASTVSVRQLTRSFAGNPPTVAVEDVSFDIDEGEFLVLLGPSGCGKTTTLRCLAGLESPQVGSVTLNGAPVFDSASKVNVPPERRSIGMVFQSYALWPHKTVRENLEYPLKARRMKQALKEDWAGEMAELVECTKLLDRYPGQLSGGQQQRVALARGLVARPQLMLFDEPLSNLDARLRNDVRAELHHLHRRLKFTAVYVTHDQDEALALGDRIAIMRAGTIEQIDTSEAIFEQPQTEYVAAFVGMSNSFVLDGQTGAWMINSTPVHGAIPFDPTLGCLSVRLRPDELDLFPADSPPSSETNAWCEGTYIDSSYAGRHRDVMVEVDGVQLRAFIRVPRGDHWVDSLQVGARVIVAFGGQGGSVYTADGRALVVAETTEPVSAGRH